ncbi:tetratricopeptide repeat protein [Desulforhabdus sp. TSK]|uniref:tetratricopeptide repeat protein n=1 Tax=Desulforhabdus sp. TSK TaxID=2925014 RepID=UPI001FC81762|nr:tetratricopeptide repeat protein [Desulforhabdus sp. TSK]GKT10960.1 hypothetical protein DSTSK_42650 [Desulforhabdus sp. TSK]
MQKILPSIFISIMLVLVFSSYCNTFYSPPILDDYHSFIEDESVYIKDLSPSSLISLSNTKFGWGRWIPMMTFALDHRLGGGQIFYFHLTNFIIHILSSLVVIFLVSQLLKSNRKEDHFLTDIPLVYCAIWVAGLWSLNPVQTNAVTYLVQRMASIQTFFYILSVSFYVLARRKHLFDHGGSKALFFYILSCFCTIGAFLSKQNAAMLPVMLLITEVWFFQPQLFSSFWARIRESHRVGWITLLLCLFLSFILSVKVFLSFQEGYAIRNFSMWERLLTEGRVVVWYLTILIWPVPSRLSIEHDVDISTSLLSPPTTLLSFIFLFFIFYLTLRYRRKFPLLTYGIVWFFLNLAIESTIIGLELVFEHRLYLPSIGFYLFLVIALVELFRSLLGKMSNSDFIKVAWSGFALVAACYGMLTFQRNEAWQDFLTLNQDVVSKAPLNSRAHCNFAVALARAQKYEEAIQEAKIAIELGKENDEQYIGAAHVIVGALIGLGNFEKAAEEGEYFLTNHPEGCDLSALPILCLQIAEAYRKMGQLSKAYSHALLGMEYNQKLGDRSYEKKLIEGMLVRVLTAAKEKSLDLNDDGQLDPGALPITTWIAKAFLNYGEREEAKKLLQEASLENPDDLETRSLSESLIQEDKHNQIQEYKGSFLDKYVKNPYSRFNACMALAYLIREYRLLSPFLKIGEKLINYSANFKPDAADAHLLKGWYYFEKEEIAQAVDCAKRSLELDPQYAKAYLGLGFFLLRANEPHEAIAAFQKALELFPGYPKRKILSDIIVELEHGISSIPRADKSWTF